MAVLVPSGPESGNIQNEPNITLALAGTETLVSESLFQQMVVYNMALVDSMLSHQEIPEVPEKVIPFAMHQRDILCRVQEELRKPQASLSQKRERYIEDLFDVSLVDCVSYEHFPFGTIMYVCDEDYATIRGQRVDELRSHGFVSVEQDFEPAFLGRLAVVRRESEQEISLITRKHELLHILFRLWYFRSDMQCRYKIKANPDPAHHVRTAQGILKQQEDATRDEVIAYNSDRSMYLLPLESHADWYATNILESIRLLRIPEHLYYYLEAYQQFLGCTSEYQWLVRNLYLRFPKEYVQSVLQLVSLEQLPKIHTLLTHMPRPEAHRRYLHQRMNCIALVQSTTENIIASKKQREDPSYWSSVLLADTWRQFAAMHPIEAIDILGLTLSYAPNEHIVFRAMHLLELFIPLLYLPGQGRNKQYVESMLDRFIHERKLFSFLRCRDYARSLLHSLHMRKDLI